MGAEPCKEGAAWGSSLVHRLELHPLARPTRTNWTSFATILGVIILVGTEVFGVALAAGWAIAGLLELGSTFEYILMGLFSLIGAYILLGLWRKATAIEPISE